MQPHQDVTTVLIWDFVKRHINKTQPSKGIVQIIFGFIEPILVSLEMEFYSCSVMKRFLTSIFYLLCVLCFLRQPFIIFITMKQIETMDKIETQRYRKSYYDEKKR